MRKATKTNHLDNLFEAVLNLKTIDECYCFFEDLCTVNELNALSQRFEVAKMLDRKCLYTDIAARTGASSATISRVSRSLIYGRGGYRKSFDRLRERNKNE